MSLLERIADRLLAALGVDLDFDLEPEHARRSRIRDGLYLGARPRDDEVEALKALGIGHVVSCVADPTSVAWLADHFSHHVIGLRDGMDADIASTLPGFFDFAADAGGLLVHCEAGVSRSATLVIALLMQTRRLSFHEAWLEVRGRRPEVLPNIGFASQLQRLELQLGSGPRAGPSSLARYLVEACHVPAELDLVDEMLAHHDHDAPRAIGALFGGEIPRVVQGVRR